MSPFPLTLIQLFYQHGTCQSADLLLSFITVHIKNTINSMAQFRLLVKKVQLSPKKSEESFNKWKEGKIGIVLPLNDTFTFTIKLH